MGSSAAGKAEEPLQLQIILYKDPIQMLLCPINLEASNTMRRGRDRAEPYKAPSESLSPAQRTQRLPREPLPHNKEITRGSESRNLLEAVEAFYAHITSNSS